MKHALLSCLLLLAPAQTPHPSGGQADQPVAIARDLVLTRGAFGDWLVDRIGIDHAQDFLVEALALREAERLGIAPDAAAVEAAWVAERDQTLAQHYHGEMEEYEAELRLRGFDPEAWIERHRREIAAELSLIAVARERRAVSEDELRQRYKDIYGELQERTTLEVLFISMYRGAEPGTMDLARLREVALQRAEEAAEQMRAGRPISELLPLGDKVNSEFVHDGVISPYRTRLLGKEVEKAQELLDAPGDVSPPVSVFDGFYVLRLVERLPVTFEAVADELLAVAREATPTSNELLETRAALLEENEAEVVLR